MSVQVEAFFHQHTSTLSYVVYDQDSKYAAVIDPVLDFDYASGHTDTRFAEQLLDFLDSRQLRLQWILETHAHADHLTAAQYVKAKAGGRIAIGGGITKVQSTFQKIYNLADSIQTDGSDFDLLFNEGDTFRLGNSTGQILATPGHTNDSLTYLIDGHAFVGDSLFMPDAGTARCDFPGGSAATLFQSVKKLYQLPDETLIYVSHDYQPNGRELKFVASVAEHKQANVHINAETAEAEFIQIRQTRDATLGMPNLIMPSIQVNIRAGHFPKPEDNGVSYLKLPVNGLG
ncbi:MBL fold metallo-hydrolase [Neptunicella sp. SCSIO 80796]|uniref:MBL fold metallo-hydrolase n=1 Tax=Neptunicella plasticusilytica TaxID=3117012 RepID=UPI003A4D8089